MRHQGWLGEGNSRLGTWPAPRARATQGFGLSKHRQTVLSFWVLGERTLDHLPGRERKNREALPFLCSAACPSQAPISDLGMQAPQKPEQGHPRPRPSRLALLPWRLFCRWLGEKLSLSQLPPGRVGWGTRTGQGRMPPTPACRGSDTSVPAHTTHSPHSRRTAAVVHCHKNHPPKGTGQRTTHPDLLLGTPRCAPPCSADAPRCPSASPFLSLTHRHTRARSHTHTHTLSHTPHLCFSAAIR